MIREEGRCGEVGYVMMWCREAWCTHVDVLVLVPQEEVVQNTSFVQVSKSDLWGRRTEEEVFTNQVTWDSSPIPHRKNHRIYTRLYSHVCFRANEVEDQYDHVMSHDVTCCHMMSHDATW